MLLTRDQGTAVNLATSGHSFFITGKGGTGKSFVIQSIYKELINLKKKVYVTCSTGIACTNLNVEATTAHSFSGIKDGRGSREVLFELVKQNNEACKRWLGVEVLIVDEISMISKHVFETLEYIARNIRSNNFPFGGIQLIGVGDFYQLPPVYNNQDVYSSNEYAFESVIWSHVFPHSVELHEVVRQSDPQFVDFLNIIREGRITEKESTFAAEYLTGKNINPLDFGVDYVPELYCTNVEVDYRNYLYLNELPGEINYYQSQDTGTKALLNRSTTTPEHLHLKVGCRVILTSNIGKKFVNGLRGLVTHFDDENHPVVQFSALGLSKVIDVHKVTVCDERDRSIVLGQRVQIPLKLGWAISVHKSQGMSLPCAIYHCGKEFAPGQLYVALSRVTSKEGLVVKRFNAARKIQIPNRVREFQDNISIGEIKNDCSCCTKKDMSLINLGAGDDLDEIFQEVWEEEDIMKEINDMFEKENIQDEEDYINLDELIENLASDDALSSPPEDFQFLVFLNAIQFADTSIDPFRVLVNNVIDELKSANRIEDAKKYLKLAWSSVYDALKNTALNEIKKQRRHFTNYVGMLHVQLTSDRLLQLLSSALEIPRDLLREEHFTVCTNIVMAINSFILNLALATVEPDNSNAPAFVDISSLNADAKGKIRYCGGWAISREREAMKKRLQSLISSKSPSVGKAGHCVHSRLALLNALSCPFSEIQETTKYIETLEVTDSRQYRSMGLTHISDDCFTFFMQLEQKRVDLINSSRLKHLKGDLLVDSQREICEDNDLRDCFRQLFTKEELDNLSHSKIELEIVDELYCDIIKRYLKMAGAQFLRDLRRDLKVQKTEAHRKKTFDKSKKKERKGAKVTLEDILKDESPHKRVSNTLLQTMLIKYPDIFTTTVYKKQELLQLCDLYGITGYKTSDKANISKELKAVILNAQDMRNQDHPHQSAAQADSVPVVPREQTAPLSRKRFRPNNDELATLMADSETDFKATAEERALQFRVTKKQILDWHRRHSGNSNSNTNN